MTSTKHDARRGARTLVLQGLYQRQLSRNADDAIRLQLLESEGYATADAEYLAALWRGTTGEYETLLGLIAPHSARAPAELSPIERAILVIGTWELVHRPDVPYKVVIDEAVELAKDYGGTDGHRYVNGVLDKLAARVREPEIAARAAESGTPG